MRKRLVAVVVVLALAGVILSRSCGARPTGRGASSLGTFAVKRGTLPITLTETGTLNAKNNDSVRAECEGEAKIAWLIDEGATVKSADVLVELDKTESIRRVEDLENHRIQGEAELKSAKSELAIQVNQNKTDSEAAQLKLEVSQVNLKKLVEGDIPKETKTRHLKIDKARAELQRAEEKYRALPDLQKLGAVTRGQVEEERLRVEEKKAELDAAEQDLDLYERFQKPLDVKQKTAEVTEAERSIERTREKAASQTEQKEAMVRQKELTLKSTLDRLQDERERLAGMTLRAPRPGIVLYGDPTRPWDDGRVKLGAQVWRGMVVVTIPDPSELQVLLKIHEADVNQLAAGMRCTVHLDSYKGLVLGGAVTKIAAVANSGGWREEGVKRFPIEVTLEGKDLNVRPGVTARCEIAIGEMKDVLHVPLHAVHVKDGKHRCYVKTALATTVREVAIGRANDSFVEIKSGLAEGEAVLLYDAGAEAVGETEKAP